MRRRCPALLLTLALPAGLLPVTLATAPAAAVVSRPDKITSVKSKPGPRPGEVTVSWTGSGKNTTYYRVDTSTNFFSRTDPNLPRQGRDFTKFYVIGGQRHSVTLSAAQAAKAGAPLGSANHLYFRLYAVHKTSAGLVERSYPYLQSVSVQPLAPAPGGQPIRVASFNVRTARAAEDTGTRSWSARAPYVARAIVAKHPGLVAIQEASPGSITGRTGDPRQTDSLLTALRQEKGGNYQMVRTTSYAKPGTPMGSQGARILWDDSRYRLVSHCPDTTGRSNWNASCTVSMPLLPGDRESERRLAAVARFADLRTGQQFWFVSVHLDARKSSDPATQRAYESLRGQQVKTVLDKVAKLNSTKLPVIFAGDINSWQSRQGSYAPHAELVNGGYYDTAAATTGVNFGYGTVNGFATTFKPTASGFGARLDVIAVKGARGALRFENVMKVTDSRRPSDHNMVVADFALPR